MNSRMTLGAVGACLSGVLACAQEGQLVPRTVMDDPSLPRVALRDGRLIHVRSLGDPAAPTVIVLHGGPGGDSRGYLHLERALPDHHVLLWDQRGSGLSERVPDDELDGPTFVADLHELGQRYSPNRPFSIIGHSWGGAFGAYYTQQHPDRVAKLVLVEPGALHPTAARAGNRASVDFFGGEFQAYLQATEHLPPASDAELDYMYVIALAGFKADDATLLGYDFWRLGYRANVGINKWQGNFGGERTFDAVSGIDRYTGPTLFINGTEDGRLGHGFQLEHHVPHFSNADVLHLPEVEHSDLLLSDVALRRLEEFLR